MEMDERIGTDESLSSVSPTGSRVDFDARPNSRGASADFLLPSPLEGEGDVGDVNGGSPKRERGMPSGRLTKDGASLALFEVASLRLCPLAPVGEGGR
jgi:hypothetical protein